MSKILTTPLSLHRYSILMPITSYFSKWNRNYLKLKGVPQYDRCHRSNERWNGIAQVPLTIVLAPLYTRLLAANTTSRSATFSALSLMSQMLRIIRCKRF